MNTTTAKLTVNLPRSLLARTIDAWQTYKLDNQGVVKRFDFADTMPRVCGYFRNLLHNTPVDRDATVEATPEGFRVLIDFCWEAPLTPNGGLRGLGAILVPVLSRHEHANQKRHPRGHPDESMPREDAPTVTAFKGINERPPA